MSEPMERVAVSTKFAESVPQLGRTALVKYCYFLQTLRKVPLGYRFSLYSYGPFDSDVLADLDSATGIGGVTSSVVPYFNSYGYKIEAGPRAKAVEARNSGFLRAYQSDIDWVIANFGSMSAIELELSSTLVYCDREAKAKREKLSIEDLSIRVRDVKPHFTLDQIRRTAADLSARGHLIAMN